MFRWQLFLSILISVLAMSCRLLAADEPIDVMDDNAFTGKMMKVLGNSPSRAEWKYDTGDFSVGGRVFNDMGAINYYAEPLCDNNGLPVNLSNGDGYDNSWVQYDIRGMSRFSGFLAVPDHLQGRKGELIISLENKICFQQKISEGDDPVFFEIPFKGKQTLRIRRIDQAFIFTPRIYKVGDILTCSKCNEKFASQVELDTHANIRHSGKGEVDQLTCAVSAKDLSDLAVLLRKQVDGKDAVKERVAKGTLALSTFMMVGYNSTSMATAATENFSIPLQKNDFTMVERGQLDKALKELKLQTLDDLMNPETVQKLGKLAGCDMLIVGSITKQSADTAMINVRLLDTASAKTLAAEQLESRIIKF